METAPFYVHNNEVVDLKDIPRIPIEDFRKSVIGTVKNGARISALFGKPTPNDTVQLFAILAHDNEGMLSLLTTEVKDSYPALTPDCLQAHWFEREIAEQWGVKPEGHPWLKPIRFHPSYRAGHDAWNRKTPTDIVAGVTDYFKVEGQEVHEVAVGPVHAGIIEPGHFRFQCHGESVLHLEISLGYQHRGVERSLIGGPNSRTIHTMETLAGDSSIAHATAYCQAVEALSGCQISVRAMVLRGIALELERIANHIGDLGALANDIGYLPTASFCGRLRGDFLNMTALICGNRFGRDLVRPGGVIFDLDSQRAAELLKQLEQSFKDATNAANLLWDTSSVRARFEETGRVSKKICDELGLVGPVARACGVEHDVRFEFPSGVYQFFQIPVSSWHTGDVFARAQVRWFEIQRSVAFIRSQIDGLPKKSIQSECVDLPPEKMTVSLIEGWRGEICHVAITEEQGRFAGYKIVDPSFHNWMGLAMALRNQQISDFPLCNKSFNLSYCGHDL